MKRPIPVILFVFLFFLHSCGEVTPLALTQTASIITPFPTSYEEPTITAFETLMAIKCPTTPTVASKETSTALTDADIQREFAGTYSFSSGFWVYILVIDCDNTFHEQVVTDFGSRMFSEGNLVVQNGQIILNGVNNEGKLYIPVRWGPRKYLIEPYKVAYFCGDTFSTDSFKGPRGENSIGFYYMRLGNNKMDVTGFPISPAGDRICQ